MDELLWTRGFAQGSYSRELVLALADELKLDRTRFESDLDGAPCEELVEADGRQFTQLGVTGTPAVYVNGRFLGGALLAGSFAAVIDVELAKACERIAAGAAAATHYQTYVLDQARPGRFRRKREQTVLALAPHFAGKACRRVLRSRAVAFGGLLLLSRRRIH